MADTTDETITQALRRLIADDGLEAETAVDKALGLVTRVKLAEYVRPIVREEARRIERRVARRIEDAAFSHPPTASSATSERSPSGDGEYRLTSGEARHLLVATRFVTPDGRWVTWGQATGDDHKARAGWQRGQATACSTDAARHEHAAKLIAAHKATCLDDIKGWGDLLGKAA